MTSGRNLLLDYFSGALNIDEMRARAAAGADADAGEALQLAEFDFKCRQILASVKPRPGAAERLGELVARVPIEDEPLGEAGHFWPIPQSTMEFDVIGAQYTPKEGSKSKTQRRTSKKAKSKTAKTKTARKGAAKKRKKKN